MATWRLAYLLLGLSLLLGGLWLATATGALAAGAGVGVAPAEIRFGQALRGGEYESRITIMNPGERVADFDLSTSGESGPWISFLEGPTSRSPIKKITIPANSMKELIIRINIPEQTANGTYSGRIIVTTNGFTAADTPNVAGGQIVSVQAGSDVKVEVTGNQVLKAQIEGMFIADTEINYPVRLNVALQNMGNVMLRPRIAAEIYEGSHLVGNYEHITTTVKPGTTEQVQMEISTRGWRGGDYTSKVKVTIETPSTRADELLGEKDINFKVLPIGTLSRTGEFRDLKVEGQAVVGQLVKIVGVFVNTGEIETPASLLAEVYREGALVDNLQSRELLVQSRHEGVLEAYMKVEQAGQLMVKGTVDYGGKRTGAKEVSLEAVAPALPPAPVTQPSLATGPSQELPSSNSWVILAVLEGAVVLVVLAGIVIWRRMSRAPRPMASMRTKSRTASLSEEEKRHITWH